MTAAPDTDPAEIATPELALKIIAGAELVLAQHREAPFAALLDRLKGADLPGLAADIRAIIPLHTGEADRMLLDQRATVLADTTKFIASMAEANAKRLTKPTGA